MSELAVRLDLPKNRWRMTKWSVEDFEGQLESDPVFLYAWATPIRAPVEPADAWGSLFVEKAEALGGANAKVTGSALHEPQGKGAQGKGKSSGGRFAFVDVELAFKGTPIVLRGATTEIDGRNFHFAVVGNAKLAKLASRERETIADRLEFTAEVPPLGLGGEVSMPRVKTRLPADWRPLQTGEFNQLSPKLAKLGIEDFTSCWLAVRRSAGTEPEVMASCSKPLHLGVVDSFSFSSHEPAVRESLFGANVPEGSPVQLPDRLGFLFTPRDGLAFGAAPDGEHVAVIWALGHAALGGSVEAALQGTTFDEPHAVTLNDHVSYWLGARLFSPMVLCPLLCCVGSVGLVVLAAGGLVAMRRGRSSSEDE